MMPLPLATKRLSFRDVRVGDAEALAPILMDPEVKRFWPRPCSREEVDAWIQRVLVRYERDGTTYWLVERLDTGQVIGHVGLLTQEIAGTHEIGLGYVFAKEHWGQGYATEAARASLEYGFQVMGQSRIVAAIRPENVASQRVAARLDMQYEKSCEYYGLEHAIYVKNRDS